MITVRPSQERGRVRLDWLDSRHTFSFGHYFDPRQMGYGPLRVINEDRVAASGGFATHGHADMEIISYVLDGALAHKDSLGTGSTIRPGDVQRMSAGTGVQHSEFNPSDQDAAHFLQIWIVPDHKGATPRYEQRQFPREVRQGALKLVVSPDGREESIAIHQDAAMYATLLAPGQKVTHALAEGRRAWVQVARGTVSLNGVVLIAGDGAAVEREAAVTLAGVEDAEVLVFDLP